MDDREAELLRAARGVVRTTNPLGDQAVPNWIHALWVAVIAYDPNDAAPARIRLIHTNDPHTRLRPGSEGTVRRYIYAAVEVDWDDGSRLALLPDEGDEWEVLP